MTQFGRGVSKVTNYSQRFWGAPGVNLVQHGMCVWGTTDRGRWMNVQMEGARMGFCAAPASEWQLSGSRHDWTINFFFFSCCLLRHLASCTPVLLYALKSSVLTAFLFLDFLVSRPFSPSSLNSRGFGSSRKEKVISMCNPKRSCIFPSLVSMSMACENFLLLNTSKPRSMPLALPALVLATGLVMCTKRCACPPPHVHRFHPVWLPKGFHAGRPRHPHPIPRSCLQFRFVPNCSKAWLADNIRCVESLHLGPTLKGLRLLERLHLHGETGAIHHVYIRTCFIRLYLLSRHITHLEYL